MKEDNKLTFVAYCRKSSEDDRQAASIGDQVRELSALATRDKVRLIREPLTEEKSAKAPGRPRFNELLVLIERGEANAILCWDIDRLYRNPIDEGRVRWLLQRGVIREIRTPYRVFYPQDAGLLMGVEGGRATDHIITLRKGVLRGFRGKLAKGHRPGVAPPGYLNNTAVEKGVRTVVLDPERFPLVRRAWELMLAGNFSIRAIQRIADTEWGLLSRKTRRQGGHPYSLSAWYRIFTDPFYTGFFWWRTPETTVRELYKGAHTPMITQEEFDRVQFLLGRHGKPAPRTHRFAFTGLIRCATCDALVTAETKYQIICSACKHKFSAPNKVACPRCRLAIERMKLPTRRYYTYYHCTKRKTPDCPERSVQLKALEEQIDELLATMMISEDFKCWVIKALHEESESDKEVLDTSGVVRRRRLREIRRQLAHINATILSPDTDWSLISRDEIKEHKLRLMEELDQLEGRGRLVEGRTGDVVELSERTFIFAAYARFWFREGDLEQKRAVLGALGSNLTLRDKKLGVDLQKPLEVLRGMINAVPPISGAFEPKNRRSTKGQSLTFESGIPCLRRGVNVIRTYWLKTIDAPPLPIFPILSTQDTKKRRRGKRLNPAA